MVIKIGDFDITECWDGVFYKKLSKYPNITTWEIQTVLDFIQYEEANGRKCDIQAEKVIIDAIDHYRPVYERGDRISPPEIIEGCTACPKYKGCMWAWIDVDLSKYDTKTHKINITLPQFLITKIDEKVATHKTLYKSRSNYLAQLAMNDLS